MKKLLLILFAFALSIDLSLANDNDSEAAAPTNQVDGKTISSLSDAQNLAVAVFAIEVYDWGTSDGLDTKVTNIRLKPYSTNTASWVNNIQGVYVNDGSNNIYPTATINDSYIDLAFAAGDLTVPDGTTVIVTVWIYLNTSNIEDETILSFMVDASNHGFIADASGSTFAATFSGDFNSNDFEINVEASKLDFKKNVSNVIVNKVMNPPVRVAYEDANGNTDKTYNGAGYEIGLTVSGSSFSASATTSVAPLNGISTFDNLLFNSTGTGISITANDGGWGNTDATSSSFKVISAPAALIISEVSDPKDNSNGRFVEIYNASSSDVDLNTGNWYLYRQVNGGSYGGNKLNGTIYSGMTYLTATNNTNFQIAYGFNADEQDSDINGNGDDAYLLYYGGDYATGTLVDIYGEFDTDGTGTSWDYLDKQAVRKSTIAASNTIWTSSEWTITTANVADMTPGTHGDCITFNGGSTSVWGTAANWVGGAIPTSSKNVKIPSGLTNNPSIDGDAASPSQCNNLLIVTNASLTIPAGKALTINDNLTNNSTAAGVLIESNSTGNGSLIVTGTETGDVTIQRYFGAYTAAGDGWYEIGSPVDGMTIAGSDFEPGTTSPDIDDLYAWDESTNTWLNYKDASPFTTFTQGQGYLAAYETAQTNSFTGELLTGDLGITSLYYTSGASHQGWNLLGNPYSSAIEWNNGGWTFTNVGTVCNVWDESAGNYVNPANGDPIPSTNGFFVQATASSNEITIPASARVHNGTNNYKSSQISDDPNTLIIKVTTDVTSFNNITKVAFKADATEAWDIQYDAHKLFGAETAPQLWTISQNDEFSLNTLPFTQEPVDLPMNFKAGIDGQYQITLEGIDNFSDEADVVLEDLFTGQSIDVRNNQTYTFTATKEDETNRFVLHFYNVTSTPELETIDSKAFIYTTNNSSIIVKAMDKELNGTIEVLNILGQTMDVNKVSHATFVKLSTHYNSGVYFVRYTEPDGYTQTRKVVLN